MKKNTKTLRLPSNFLLPDAYKSKKMSKISVFLNDLASYVPSIHKMRNIENYFFFANKKKSILELRHTSSSFHPENSLLRSCIEYLVTDLEIVSIK